MSGERAHARLSPSGSAGWSTCPHWENDGQTSVYAAQGTMHHEVAARVLSGDATVQQHVGVDFEIDGHTIPFGLDEAVAVEDYIAMLRELPEGLTLVEVEVPIDHITGEKDATGTADFVRIAGTHWHVVDAKFGHGLRVRPKDNTQLIMYALGVIRFLIEDQGEIDVPIPEQVTLHIAQPYLGDRLDSWTYTVDELWTWKAELWEAAMRHVFTAPDNVTLAQVPSVDGCRYCMHRHECPALTGQVEQAVGLPVESMPEGGAPAWEDRLRELQGWEPERLGAALSAVELVRLWAKAIEGEAHRRARAGEVVPGHKLVQGKRGTRSWANEGVVETLLRKTWRIKAGEVYSQKLLTPAQLEKRLAKKQPARWAKLLEHIVQPDGEPTLAPWSDPRPAIQLVPVVEMFDDLDGADLA